MAGFNECREVLHFHSNLIVLSPPQKCNAPNFKSADPVGGIGWLPRRGLTSDAQTRPGRQWSAHQEVDPRRRKTQRARRRGPGHLPSHVVGGRNSVEKQKD